MKIFCLFGCLLCVLQGSPALADECSIDTLELTRIKNIKPAVSLDSFVGRLISEVAAFVLTKSVPLKASLVSKAASMVDIDTLNDPLNVDLKVAVEDVVNYINQNDLDPDDLVVRINGIRVVPYSTSSSSCYENEPCYTMAEGGQIPFFGNKIKQSFRKAATFQLIEADDGSLNDDLGMVTVGVTGVLFGKLPAPLVIDQIYQPNFELGGTNVTHGKVELSRDGSYSFDVGTDFNDLGVGEIREVTFSYIYTYYNESNPNGVVGDEQLRTITVTGTGSNIAPIATDASGASSDTPPQSIFGTTLMVFAAADDASVYEVTFTIERGTGNLDKIAERLKCDSKQCTDARENRGMDNNFAKSCPAGYQSMDGEGASYSGRLCEAIRPSDCGSNFNTLDSVASLKHGDVIVLKGHTPPAYGISPDGQYLSVCNGCAGSSYNAVVASIDPNRSDAQWIVKKVGNGKIALRSSATGGYLARCFQCVPGFDYSNSDLGLGHFAWVHAPEPLGYAQFSFLALGGGKYALKADNDRYLSTCFNCVPLQTNIPGFQYSVDMSDDISTLPRSAWKIRVKRPNVVTKSTDFVIAQDEVINPSDNWVISPGVVLTVNKGVTLTVKDGVNLDNQGTIVNHGKILIGDAGVLENSGNIVNGSYADPGIIRVSKGVIFNQAGALIDNSDGNHIQNYGGIANLGVIFDPWSRYYGSNPTINPLESGYYLGAGSPGEKSCGWIDSSPVPVWNVDTNTCTVGNTWLRAGKPLTIANGAALVVIGKLTNDATINNNGTIDNNNGLIRQCGAFNGTDPTAPGNFDTVCDKSPDQLLCEEYVGSWDDPANICRNVSGKRDYNTGDPIPIAYGETLTIRNDLTWEITGYIESEGEIHVEQGGAIILLGGSIKNSEIIVNAGHISIGMDGTEGFESEIENLYLISNYGTINNDVSGGSGTIHGDGGYVDNFCGSVYALERQPASKFHNTITDNACPPPPPDSDSDGVEDGLDAFPNNEFQTSDLDGDGFGDNEFNPPFDMFPQNVLEHTDSDGDCGIILFQDQTASSGNGCGDNSDDFYLNSLEQKDSDGDCGNLETLTQTATLGNGCGDNSDALPLNQYELLDSDADGFGDNSDRFPLNLEEHEDTDGDCGVILTQIISSGTGCGDNSDPYPYDPDNTRSINLDNSNGWITKRAVFVPVDSIPEPPPAGSGLTRGLVELQITSPSVGEEASLTIIYPEPFDPNTVWWKYGPTTANNLPHWYMFDGAVFSANTVTLTITDGGFGDDDLIENGSITDPGGPGLSETTSAPEPSGDSSDPATTGGGSGGGAFNLWILILLSSLLLRHQSRLGSLSKSRKSIE